MLTRRQVAARLGKSVATVRRIEGRLLEPVRDRRGTYKFDEDAVTRLVDEVAQGRVCLWKEFRDPAVATRFSRRVHGSRTRAGTEPYTELVYELRARLDAADERERTLRRENAELREAIERLDALLLAI